jgi:hypothetical protein
MSLFLDKLLIIGGGGGGGSGTYYRGGGGGAGEYIETDNVAVLPQSYDIVIGPGGSGGGSGDYGLNGSNSTAFGYTAKGGGGGAAATASAPKNGNIGGSGGGASGGTSGNTGTGGASNATTGVGYAGGNGAGADVGGSRRGGGGGGAGGVGVNANNTRGGNGGPGVTSSITGSSVTRAGGGGGGSASNSGTGGTGGGGNGTTSSVNATNGTPNTGSGGGGSGSDSPNGTGGDGGSGVVILRYTTTEFGVCTGGTKTTNGTYTIHTFTANGTFVVNTLPEIQTLTPTAVTKTTVTGNGDLVSDGGETITEMGFVLNTSPNPTIGDTKVLVTNGEGAYSSNITGLTENTPYYMRAFVTLATSGTLYGAQVTFTTLPPVTLATYAVTEITQNTAVANGEIMDDGGETITERGFVWALTTNPTTLDNKVIVAGTLGTYSGDMDSLTEATLYYVRAYAIADGVISYGENRTFTTASDLARVGALDTGYTDYGTPIYWELIDRWRSFTDMYAKDKSISGLNIYTENAAGTRIYFQAQKSPANVWEDLGTVTSANNALMPNSQTTDFDVGRLRLSGFTSGTPIVIHGIEILSINDKGFNQN